MLQDTYYHSITVILAHKVFQKGYGILAKSLHPTKLKAVKNNAYATEYLSCFALPSLITTAFSEQMFYPLLQ